MAQTATPPPARRGRPRSERARRAIIDATAELLTERGLQEITADDIAHRAGVSKATIYRWWESKEAVAFDAFVEALRSDEGPVPDTGSLAGDLEAALLARTRGLRRRPWVRRTMAALVAEIAVDPGLREAYVTRVMAALRTQGRAVFERAIERGEVPADLDVEVALDLVYGPLYHRVFHRHQPLTERFARAIAALVAAGLTEGDIQKRN